MKALYIVLILLITASCISPQKMYDDGFKKVYEAIKRDSTLALPADTVKITEYDTIFGKDGEDLIIHTKETITLPCKFDEEAFKNSIKEKSRRELRFERRTSKDSLRHMEKMYRLETKRMQDSLVSLNKANRELTKQLRDNNTTTEKLAKQDTKQKRGNWFTRMMGRIWWLLLILGLVGGFILRGYIPSIFGILK
jgi:hypothetical protein